MPTELPRRERLVELLALAQNYRGWSRRQLAAALDRDIHNLIPSTGNPKLDLVVRLADVLDWPIEMVVEDLCHDEAPPERPSLDADVARARVREAFAAYSRGELTSVIELATSVLRSGAPSDLRSYAAHLASLALEDNGRYHASIEIIREGLQVSRLQSPGELRLRAGLAYCHYVLGSWREAEGLAESVVEALRSSGTGDMNQILAHALYVRGNARRELALREPRADQSMALAALRDLDRAATLLADREAYGGSVADLSVAETSRAAARQMRVELGEESPRVFLDDCLAAIRDEQPRDEFERHRIESQAWICIFGSATILRHLMSEADAERALAILTNKADEAAEKLGHWELRRHVWTVEHLRRREIDAAGGVKQPWVLDEEDLRTLAGTMGRFPAFRTTGWRVLREVMPDAGGES